MDNHEHDVERAAKLMRGLVANMYDECERNGFRNVRIEHVGIIGIVAFEDPDGDEAEDVFTAFETTRHHVKVGILTSVIQSMKRDRR